MHYIEILLQRRRNYAPFWIGLAAAIIAAFTIWSPVHAEEWKPQEPGSHHPVPYVCKAPEFLTKALKEEQDSGFNAGWDLLNQYANDPTWNSACIIGAVTIKIVTHMPEYDRACPQTFNFNNCVIYRVTVPMWGDRNYFIPGMHGHRIRRPAQ